MVFFNYATMQMAAKIVYYGPGLCGKTTNLHQIYAKTNPTSRGEMVSLETETDRTLFFDLLPLDVGVIGGFKTRLQLYTVPGQVFYNTTRKLVLKGADGIVFVADSQRAMLDANVESLKNLRENLTEAGLNLDEMPVVIQLNKRDLPSALDRETLVASLDPEGRYEFVEASAVKGEGVFETLKLISKLTLRSLRKRMMGDDEKIAPSPRTPQKPVFVVHDRPAPAAAPEPERTAEAEPLFTDTVESPLPVEVELPPAPDPIESYPTAEETDDALESGPAPEMTEQPASQDQPEHAAPAEPEESGEADAEAAQGREEPAEPEPEIAFDESPESAPIEQAPAPAVRHVKVRSTVDIMAELEDLRKKATQTPARGKLDVLSALDALTGTKSRRDLTRSLSEKISRAITDRTRTVDVEIAFRGEDGEIHRVRQQIDLDTPGWDTLKLNIRIEPESGDVR